MSANRDYRLHRAVRDLVRYKHERRQMIRLGLYSAERLRAIRRQLTTSEPLPESAVKLIQETQYRGFVIRVYQRLDIATALVYQALVFRPGKLARQIFVRSKSVQICREHFTKRAIDCWLATGHWPTKQGISLCGREQ